MTEPVAQFINIDDLVTIVKQNRSLRGWYKIYLIGNSLSITCDLYTAHNILLDITTYIDKSEKTPYTEEYIAQILNDSYKIFDIIEKDKLNNFVEENQ